MAGRFNPPLVPSICRELPTEQPEDTRRIAEKLQIFLEQWQAGNYASPPADHDHSGSGSGGTLAPAAYEPAEAMAMIAWMRATE